MGLFTALVKTAVDATAVSTTLATIRRTTGYAVPVSAIRNESLRKISQSFLNVGEYACDQTLEILQRVRKNREARAEKDAKDRLD
eukprot:ANDGO_02185.mRNA.1 hypothetical protein DFA_05023